MNSSKLTARTDSLPSAMKTPKYGVPENQRLLRRVLLNSMNDRLAAGIAPMTPFASPAANLSAGAAPQVPQRPKAVVHKPQLLPPPQGASIAELSAKTMQILQQPAHFEGVENEFRASLLQDYAHAGSDPLSRLCARATGEILNVKFLYSAVDTKPVLVFDKWLEGRDVAHLDFFSNVSLPNG